MRIKNKFYCDYCGNFVRITTKQEDEYFNERRKEGSSTAMEVKCKKCKRLKK